MYQYVYPHNRRVVPFVAPSTPKFSIPTGSYRVVKSRNALHNEKISPYLHKVYQNQMHAKTVDALRQTSIDNMNFDVPGNLVTRAISTLLFKVNQ